MTYKLVAIGNSRGVILSKTMLADAGLEQTSEVDITVDDGRIVIEAKAPSDPLAALRSKLGGVDADVMDAVIAAAAKKARAASVRTLKRGRGK
jgi:antitoxin component of MazEF toxin-antitoxin module